MINMLLYSFSSTLFIVIYLNKYVDIHISKYYLKTIQTALYMI